jgi:hypothetical protein
LAAFPVSLSFTQSVGLFGEGISQSQGRYLQTEQTYRHQYLNWKSNARYPVFERAKTVDALDRAATVMGTFWNTEANMQPDMTSVWRFGMTVLTSMFCLNDSDAAA